jgi:hypothetical protein
MKVRDTGLCDGTGTHTPHAINTLNATTRGKIALVDFFHHMVFNDFGSSHQNS